MTIEAQYRAFCAAHPPRYRTIDGVVWEYIACGQGNEVMVLLPGGFGAATTAFAFTAHREADFAGPAGADNDIPGRGVIGNHPFQCRQISFGGFQPLDGPFEGLGTEDFHAEAYTLLAYIRQEG